MIKDKDKDKDKADDDQTDGERLRIKFDLYKAKTGMNKTKFARAFKIPGGASMISQHISGHRPIGLDAAIAYARGFNCPIADISPRLAANVVDASTLTNTVRTFPSLQPQSSTRPPPCPLAPRPNSVSKSWRRPSRA